MNFVQSVPQFYPQHPPPMPEASKKIVVESYEEYIPKEYDNLQDLNISDDDSE